MRFVALVEAIPQSLATAVGISAASHLAFYGLTPVLSLHLAALGGTSTQVGLLFSTVSLVAVALRPAAGAWIDRQGVRQALLPGAALMVLNSLGLQAATRPLVFIGVMAGFGAGFGLATMAAAVQAASAPADRRGSALGVYYLTPPVSMAVAAVASAPGTSPLWSRGALPLSSVLARRGDGTERALHVPAAPRDRPRSGAAPLLVFRHLLRRLVALVVDRMPARERGVAIGTVSGAWDLDVFAGSLSIAAIVERASYGAGFATATALTVIALGGLVLTERRRVTTQAT